MSVRVGDNIYLIGAQVRMTLRAAGKRHLDITRSSTPLPGGRDDSIKKTMRGDVVSRDTGGPPWRPGRC